jgi:hypothetical protein
MAVKPLLTEAVRRASVSLREDLGRADRVCLESIMQLIGTDGRIRVADVLSRLYPNQDRDSALRAFRQLRGRLGTAAEKAGASLTLEVEDQKSAAP